MTFEPHVIADRYIAQWNEADPARRKEMIRALWHPEAEHFTPTRAFKGHAALDTRVEEAFLRFVQASGYQFRISGQPLGHHATVKFHWEMVRPGSDAIDARGSDVLRLDDEGRILSDHQFTEPLTAPI